MRIFSKKSAVSSSAEFLFNHLIASVLVLSPQERILYMNPAAERLLGVSNNFGKNRPLKDFLGGAEPLFRALHEVKEMGRTVFCHELTVQNPGKPLLLQAEVAPLGAPDQNQGFLLWMQELSVTHVFQEESRMLDRLSMMDVLSSGLAHEIRNPLGGIRAAAQMLQRETLSSEHREYLIMIISEVDRLNQLMSRLLDLGRPKKFQKRPININQLISEILVLQKEKMDQEGIVLKKEFDPSLPQVEGDADLLKQAFLNIIKNALEAMEGGGLLHLSTHFVNDYRMQLKEGATQSMVQIIIGDSGSGISEENMSFLFTPFFTTKPHGTGLGLILTQRIIKEHEGLMRVSSNQEKGTQFKIFLKLASATTP
jgi:two-component system nitrogen regulation sensor histidine kinase GlnL